MTEYDVIILNGNCTIFGEQYFSIGEALDKFLNAASLYPEVIFRVNEKDADKYYSSKRQEYIILTTSSSGKKQIEFTDADIEKHFPANDYGFIPLSEDYLVEMEFIQIRTRKTIAKFKRETLNNINVAKWKSVIY